MKRKLDGAEAAASSGGLAAAADAKADSTAPPADGAAAGPRGAEGVRPAPGPGDGVTPSVLRSRWDELTEASDVIEFYCHTPSGGEYRSFSNFYDSPFEFVVPAEFCSCPLTPAERTVSCPFSEKAIMLCKAAAMGDADSYSKIAALGLGSRPSEAKALGRQVRGFNSRIWDPIVCSVAYAVVYQKFLKSPCLQATLLGTAGRLIAEATTNDRIWGIGLDVGDPRVRTPASWLGTNILGWALMEARDALTTEAPAEKRAKGP